MPIQTQKRIKTNRNEDEKVKNFTFAAPTRVVFGSGAAGHLHELCESLGAKKVFVAADPNLVATPAVRGLITSLEEHGFPCTVFSDIVAEPPIEVVDAAADILKESGCDVIIAVGGGSSIDISKAMAMLMNNPGSVRDYLFGGSKTVTNPSLPLISVPTTAGSGSEVTAASVISDTANNIKLSVSHPYLFPRFAVVDPLMQTGMPAFVTATTGVDALTHAIEAYVSLRANPYSDMYAVSAISKISANLRTALSDPGNIEARGQMAIASVMAATAFASGGLGAVHGISQAMGGVVHVSHGHANSMMLSHVMEKNLAGNLTRFAHIAELMGEKTDGLSLREAASRSVICIRQLVSDLQIPAKLQDAGVTAGHFPAIVKGTMEYRLLPDNPVRLTQKDVYAILEKAF